MANPFVCEVVQGPSLVQQVLSQKWLQAMLAKSFVPEYGRAALEEIERNNIGYHPFPVSQVERGAVPGSYVTYVLKRPVPEATAVLVNVVPESWSMEDIVLRGFMDYSLLQDEELVLQDKFYNVISFWIRPHGDREWENRVLEPEMSMRSSFGEIPVQLQDMWKNACRTIVLNLSEELCEEAEDPAFQVLEAVFTMQDADAEERIEVLHGAGCFPDQEEEKILRKYWKGGCR